MSEKKPGEDPVVPTDAPTRKVAAPDASSSVSNAALPDETHDYNPSQSQALPPKAGLNAPPRAFGRYTVQGILGQGSYGTVYKGHDTQLDRAVAIKVQRTDRPGHVEQSEEFLQEARRLARLRHPGIVTVHDIGIQDGMIYIVSDFVEGVTLKDWLKLQRPSWQEATRIGAAVAAALGHAHAHRMVHRDVKPGNIILTADLQPILVDFGLGLDDKETASQRGIIMGTPAYMSPEQASGQAHRIDGRTDIYGLGVVLYELLTGRVPFAARLTEDVLRQVLQDEPQPPRQLVPQVPRELELICLKAMAKVIHARFTTAGDLAEQLTKVLAGLDTQVRQAGEHPTLNVAAPAAPPAAPVAVPPPPDKGGSSARQLAAARTHEPERRQLTLLTCGCDLFESADFLEGFDYEEQVEVQRDYQQTCASTVEHHEGAVIQMTEKGLLACFGFPIAHEDAAARAVRAGLDILRAIAPLRDRLQRAQGIAFATSIVVHTGMTVVSGAEGPGHEAFSVMGEARNAITRLDNVARPDAVVISQTAYRLVQGYFVCEPLGAFAVKGATKPLEFYQATRENESQSRVQVSLPAGLTPLIGRDREVGLLQDRWEQAIEGMGQVVLLIGDAGLGKSRLVHVIREHVMREPGGETKGDEDERRETRDEAREKSPASRIIEWRCSPYHQGSGLYPAVDFFQRWLRFERDELPEAKFAKLHEHLQQVGLADVETVPVLAALLSVPTDERYAPLNLSPARLKEKTLESLLAWLRVQAARQPILFIVEDLHWVDPSTLELLALHVERGFNDRMLTLMTFRPEFETPWKTRAHQTVMALNRLTRRQINEFMQRQTGVKKLPQALIEQMTSKTDGVPLFVEEYTKMIVESGRFRQGDAEGEAEISGTFLTQEIPATLQDLLAARLDRMASNRDVVQLGATLGREFTYELLHAVSPLDEIALKAELDKLVKAELLYQKGAPPQAVYTFKHALIQDAAYLALLKSKRQQVHRQVAEALETQFAEVAAGQPELLAHHFTEAGDLPKAVGYWALAGLRSKDKSANIEAIDHFRRGLELLAKLPEAAWEGEAPAEPRKQARQEPRPPGTGRQQTRERDQKELLMQIPLGTTLIAARGYAAPEIGPVFERARVLCLQLGETKSLLAVLWGIWAWRIVREELDLCLHAADEVMRLADSQADPGILMEAQFVSGLTHFYLGHNAQALANFQKGMSLFDPDRCKLWSHYTGQNSRITQGIYLALTLWQMGYPDQALHTAQETVELARLIAHPYSLAFALHHQGWLFQYLRQGKQAEVSAAAAIAVANEQGFPFWKATGTLCRACGLLLQKRPTEALELAQQGLAVFPATGAALSLAHYYSYVAEAYGQLGRHAEALRWLDDALAASTKNHNEFFLPELHRLKGEILWSAPGADLAAVEACFQTALAVAAQQGAKSWELRAAMSLARLRHQQGRPADARAILSVAHSWFTEGFTTPDLQDAQKLLDAWV